MAYWTLLKNFIYLTHLILITTLWGFYYSHFTDEQIEFKQFALITQLVSNKAGIWCESFSSKFHALNQS